MRSETDMGMLARLGRWQLLLWATLASVLCGVVGLGEVAEDRLRMARNGLHADQASGNIVFVGVDDKSLNQVGKWPWGRDVQARLIDQATKAGADRIFIDLIYDSPGNPAEDRELQRALAQSGRVTLADRAALGVFGDLQEAIGPLAKFASVAKTASITVYYNYQSAVWRIPVKAKTASGEVPTFAAAMSGKDFPGGRNVRIDYSIEPGSVPYHSAADLLLGRVNNLSGKTIILGLNADQLGDQFWIPGHGRMAGAYVHVLGAETLKRGMPNDLAWYPALMIALLAGAASIMSAGRGSRIAVVGGTAAALLILPIFLEKTLVFVDIVPGLLALVIVSSRQIYVALNSRGLVNDMTGLPNFVALKHEASSETRALVVARVHNQQAINAALGEADSKEASRQIVARLAAGDTARLFHGEDGTFAWLIDGQSAFGNHLEALHSMFRSPIAVGGRQIDVALSFGVEMGATRAIGSRLASAILAADEAWTEGLRWKLHDPSRQEEVDWRISLLGELDAAIDHGEVWLAYQPQLDIRTGRVIGAEALARWTHPSKGPISPSEFVAAAEANGRIGKLTDFVLERAISSAAAINRRGVDFQIAVNLSARLLSDRNLLERIRRMLTAHSLAPGKLTLELTETAALHDAESGLATFDALRALGVRIAIDDYGTGLSTLDYLKKIPANEIKIDQSFVKSMRLNRSDHIMVQSTIALAHSLDRTVVAEGVEDKQCLDELARLGCDIAQGFAIGRPMGVRELVQRLQIRSVKRVA